MVSFFKLWKNHPGTGSYPCDRLDFPNQCAIRMGVALRESNIDLSSFSGVKCWHGHEPKRHILRAQELANWISENNEFGRKKVYKFKSIEEAFSFDKGIAFKTGIIFIQDGWTGGIDHIDLWFNFVMKAGDNSYLTLGKEIWFWNII